MAKQLPMKAFVTEANRNGSPVRLEVREGIFGGWFLCNQAGVTMGEPFASIEKAYDFRSKVWAKSWAD